MSTKTISQRRGSVLSQRSLGWSGLQVRMTISYVWVTVVLILLLEIALLMVLAFIVPLATAWLSSNVLRPMVVQQVRIYALEASLQAKVTGLSVQNFVPGQVGTLAPVSVSQSFSIIKNTLSEANHELDREAATLTLLIAPDGVVLASSNPLYAPGSKLVFTLLPKGAQLITKALQGVSDDTVYTTAGGHGVVSAVETVWDQDHKVIGALYGQVPEPFIRAPGLWNLNTDTI